MKPKPWILLVAALSLSISGKPVAAQVFTPVKTVKAVYVNIEAYYVTNTAGPWDAPGCPANEYVRVLRIEPNSRELLSVLLTAKAGSREIAVSVTCASGWVDTNYIILY